MKFVDKVEKAKELVKQALAEDPNAAVAISWGKDSMVLLDIARRVRMTIKAFALMSNTEFEETEQLKKDIMQKWSIDYEQFNYDQPKDGLCCQDAKVEAMKEAVVNKKTIITGVRKDEGETRKGFKHVETHQGLKKYNPILDFTELDVWRYLAAYNVPVNPLYQEGFRSLGCKTCSNPEEDETEDERSGRWKGTDNAAGECRIHTTTLR